MMNKFKLAVLNDYQGFANRFADWSTLDDSCEVTFFNQHFENEQSTIEKLKQYQIICCMRERTVFNAEVLAQLPRLKLLVTSGMRNAAIDLAAAKNHNIMVCGTESHNYGASELAWALLLSLARNIIKEDARTKRGQWQTTIGADLYGSTLGIVGLGRLGSNMARYAKAFGMKIIAWSQNLTQAQCDPFDVQAVSKETLFSQSDFISIHLKMSKRYEHCIAEKELKQMKTSAYLINTSRASIIKEQALIRALEKQQIAGVGLDVFETEPIEQNHSLLRFENAILTSHIGFVTEKSYSIFYGQTLEAVKAWLENKPIRILN